MPTLRGRRIHGSGRFKAILVAVKRPISFLGDVDAEGGFIKVGGTYLELAGRVLAIPYSTGSTVGPYVMYRLAKRGKAPLAILAVKPDTLLLIGSIISNIPLIVNLPEEILNYGGCLIELNIDEASVSIPDECKASNADT
mgnify:CR=1 FL=1